MSAGFAVRIPPRDIGSLRADYVAQGLGMFITWNMATFLNAQFTPSFQPVPINTFAPTTTDFVDDWIARATDMKAKYICFTTKHRDGFCLWATATKSYNVAQTTWYQSGGGFDIVKKLTDEARAAGLKVVIYWQPAGDSLANCEAQLTELTSNYGAIEAIWLDGPNIHSGNPSPWPDAATLLSFMHGLQAGLLLVANVHPGGNFDLNHTDIFEYEGPTLTPPNGNVNAAEQADTVFSGRSNAFWFYETWLANTTATAGTANTITLPGGSASNGFYAGMDVIVTAGTGAGQRRTILAYNGSTGVFTTTSNWSVIPDATSVCTVLPALRTLAQLNGELATTNGNGATYLLNASPDTSGHIPSDQATLFAAFGAAH